jgi:hypothetical protein
MSKINLLIAHLLILICVFWLNSSHLSAEPCPPDCPGPTSTIAANAEYKDSWIFKWADDNPEFIPLGGSDEVRVEGGVPNFKWQVAGDGFSLQESETTDRTNTLSVDGTACGEATITVEDKHKQQVQGTVRAKDESFVWDEVNSPKEFPSSTGSVDVYVIGGQGPYTWQVNTPFTLACTENCGTSNTVTSDGTGCIAEITVTDSCGNQATGKVRRPGYWDTQLCYRYKLPICYNNWCNSLQPTEVDFVSHKVEFSCCGDRGDPEVTGTCDGFEYTASIYDCHLYSFCWDDPSYDPGIFSLYIRKWICY